MRRSFDLALSCMDVASRQEYETIAANRSAAGWRISPQQPQ